MVCARLRTDSAILLGSLYDNDAALLTPIISGHCWAPRPIKAGLSPTSGHPRVANEDQSIPLWAIMLSDLGDLDVAQPLELALALLLLVNQLALGTTPSQEARGWDAGVEFR